jgi:hypothetical protein
MHFLGLCGGWVLGAGAALIASNKRIAQGVACAPAEHGNLQGMLQALPQRRLIM